MTDSTAAMQTVLSLATYNPPRSAIEAETKSLLMERTSLDATSWVRSHTGIIGDEKADTRAVFDLALGQIAGSQRIATEGGITVKL